MIKGLGVVLAALALFALGVISTPLLISGSMHRTAYRGVDCQISDIANAKTPMDKKLLQAEGDGWMSSAQVCSIGGFTVAVPAAQTEGHIINIYKGKKPVFQRDRDGSLDYSPTVPDGRFDQDVVNIWHPCEGDVTRLLYTTRGKPQIIQIGDLDFDGRPDIRYVWNGTDLAEANGMYKDSWHRMDKGKMLIDGQWAAVHFDDGEWRIRAPSDTEPLPGSSDAFTCRDSK